MGDVGEEHVCFKKQSCWQKRQSLRASKHIWHNKLRQRRDSVRSLNTWVGVRGGRSTLRPLVWWLRLGSRENEESGIRSERSGCPLACMSSNCSMSLWNTQWPPKPRPTISQETRAFSVHCPPTEHTTFSMTFSASFIRQTANEWRSSGNKVHCSELRPTV